MVYIRTLLMKIRSINSRLNDKQRIALVILFFLLIGVGSLMDYFLPFNYLLNTLRAFVAIAIGLMLFAGIYLFSISRQEKRVTLKGEYLTFREKFSYKERVNISVILWGLWLLVLVLFTKENTFFTLFSSLMITGILFILSFVRSSREETATATMGFEDARDVLFEKKREEELARREEERKLKEEE